MAALTLSFNHLALSVKDLNKSAEFYKTVLNLEEITNKTEKKTIRWFALGQGIELHLISNHEGEVKTNKAVHLALSTSNFDFFIEKLNSLNVVFSNFKGTLNTINIRPDGIKQVFFQDPNGYWIEVNNID